MLKNGNKKCDHSDDIVSYIYDEIDTAGRRRFESHLALCEPCTDEFAAVSDARFSVFEWQKEEFAPLATPKFVIPYRADKAVNSGGLFAGLSELLALVRSPMAVGAALTVLLGIGLIAFNLIGGDSELVATNAVPVVAVPVKENAPIYENESTSPATDEPDRDTVALETVDRKPVSKPARVVKTRRTPNAAPTPRAETQARKPTLADFKEEEDKTLRLSDLFDDIGG